MANTGFFIITDISGYTEFLTQSELDHAQVVLQHLFDAQLAQIKPPIVVSSFQGDAIFMYIPDQDHSDSQDVIELLINFYRVFSDAVRQLHHTSTCPCRACQNMDKLGLKMVIHHGEYIIQRLANREELLGADVIVPHRMLKNRVTEQTGISCYALFSQSAAQALKLSDTGYPLVPHVESYEHLGEVKMKVLDVHEICAREQAID